MGILGDLARAAGNAYSVADRVATRYEKKAGRAVWKQAKSIDDAQSRVTGIHAKTAVKTYADPFRADYWREGTSALSPRQQQERDRFAEGVMAFHGVGGPVGGKGLAVQARAAGHQVGGTGRHLVVSEAGQLGGNTPRKELMAKRKDMYEQGVTFKKMSPTAMAEAKAKREGATGPAAHPTYMHDLVAQKGRGGIVLANGDEGVDKLVATAKDPKHKGSTFHDAGPIKDKFGTDPWNKGLDPNSMNRHAIVVTPDGHVHVGDAGMHHHQVMQAAGIKNGEGHLQSELYRSTRMGPDTVPAKFHTDNGISLSGGSLDPNPAQAKAISRFLEAGNGRKFVPMHGEVTPRSRVTTAPTVEQMRERRARLREKTQGMTPAEKAETLTMIDRARQAVGKKDPHARDVAMNEIKEEIGAKPKPLGFQSKRKVFGVQPGGMRRPEEGTRVIVPSRTTKPQNRPDRLH